MQPFLLQSFEDEFGLRESSSKPNTPAVPGSVLEAGDEEHQLKNDDITKCQLEAGKPLHLMKWLRSDACQQLSEGDLQVHEGSNDGEC